MRASLVKKVLAHGPGVVAERVEPPGGEVCVEEERAGHLQHLGLAAAVAAAQDQPAVVEVELLVAILPDAHQAQAQRLEPGAGGSRGTAGEQRRELVVAQLRGVRTE